MARMIWALLGAGKDAPPALGKKLKRILFRGLRAIAIGYVAAAFLIFAFQSKLLYFPNPKSDAVPSDLGMSYEEVEFSASDGVKLHGWFVPAAKPVATLLFCHGNAGDVSYRIHTLCQLNRMGMSTMIFDYRGYGLSEGEPGEEGTYMDARAGWDYLTEQRGIPAERIVIFGRSLGGAIAAHLAADVEPAALVIDSSFTSVSDRASEMLWMFPTRLLCRFEYDTEQYLRGIRCPVMVMHAREDELIPFHHGEKLYESANEPKQFLVRQGGHNDALLTSSQSVHQEFLRFVTAGLAPACGGQ